MVGEHNVYASDFHLIMPGVSCYKNNLAKISDNYLCIFSLEEIMNLDTDSRR
jgi:hypothetical protein